MGLQFDVRSSPGLSKAAAMQWLIDHEFSPSDVEMVQFHTGGAVVHTYKRNDQDRHYIDPETKQVARLTHFVPRWKF